MAHASVGVTGVSVAVTLTSLTVWEVPEAWLALITLPAVCVGTALALAWRREKGGENGKVTLTYVYTNIYTVLHTNFMQELY